MEPVERLTAGAIAVSRIYSITGADSERIVAAIHAVQSVLGRGLSVDELVQTAKRSCLIR